MKTQYIRQWLGDVNENEPPPAEQSPPTTPPMGRRGLSEEEILNRTNMRERLFGKRKSPKPVKDKTFDLKPRHPTRPDRYESKDVLRAVDQVQASRKMKRNVLKKRHDANFHAANPSQLRVVRAFGLRGFFERVKASMAVNSRRAAGPAIAEGDSLDPRPAPKEPATEPAKESATANGNEEPKEPQSQVPASANAGKMHTANPEIMGAHRISAAVNPISQEEQPSIIHHPSDDQPTSRHPGNQDRPGNQSGSHTPYTRLESVIRNPSVVYNHYLETLLPPDLSHGNPQPTAYNPTKGYMDLDELNNLLKKRKRAQTPESEGNGTFDDRNPKRRQCLPPSQTRPYSGEARQYDSLRNRKSADPKTASRHQNLLYRHSLRRAFDHNSPAYHTKPRVSSELRHTQDSDMNEDTIHPPILESEDTSNINTYKRHPQYPSYLSNPPLNKNNAHDSHIVDPLPSYRSSEHSTPPEHPLSLPPVSGVTLSELTARFPNCPEGCLSMFDDEEYQKILAQRRYREKIAEDSLPAGFWRENKLY